MRFSLIATTRWGERTNELKRLICSLKEQSHTEFELILIAQSVRPVSDDELQRTLPDAPFMVSKIVAPCSLSRARNIGATLARYDLIAFPDDDCWYPNDLLAEAASRIQGRKLDCICTGVFDPDRKLSYGKRPLDCRREIGWKNVFKLPISVGLFMRRNALKDAGLDCATGLFDEQFGAGARWGCGEEADLVCRLLAAKKRIEYDGYLRAFHEVLPYQPNDPAKYMMYGRGFGASIGKWIAHGRFGVLYAFADSEARSAAGFVANALLGRSVSSRTYLTRGTSAWLGLYEGLLYYRKALAGRV